MSYKKKISVEQYLFDIVQKEFDIVNSGVKFKDLKEMEQHCKGDWYEKFSFTKEQYEEWKAYCLNHFYDWQPKRISKQWAEETFGWINLNYGFVVEIIPEKL